LEARLELSNAGIVSRLIGGAQHELSAVALSATDRLSASSAGDAFGTCLQRWIALVQCMRASDSKQTADQL
jgi:hypothetical protein